MALNIAEYVRSKTGCPYQNIAKANLWKPESGYVTQIIKECPHNLFAGKHVVTYI